MAKQKTIWDVCISSECIQRMNEMEKLYGNHYPQHDELREEYKMLVNSAAYVEETEKGSIILYFETREEWEKAREAKESWWSDVISWSVGND